MKKPMLCTTSLLLALMGGHVLADRSTESPDVINVPPVQLAWKATEEGVAFAPLIGRRFEEPYMAMVQLPGGLVSPPHIKTANMFGVVIAGTMTHVAVGAEESEEVNLPAGSFYKIPANLPHVSKCVSEIDCVTFLYQDGKFDFLPMEK